VINNLSGTTEDRFIYPAGKRSFLLHFQVDVYKANDVVFLGAFAKPRKAIIDFIMSVCMEQFGSHWTFFHEI